MLGSQILAITNTSLSDVGHYLRTPDSSSSISDLAWIVKNHGVDTLDKSA